MKFPEIEIQNFLPIGHAKLSLADLGLAHISGVNEDETSADSNGAGKSSVPDALNWCLWGTTARGVSGDEVVNATAGKGCFVSTVIEDGDDKYKVIRHRKNGKHKNALQLLRYDAALSEWEDETKGTTALTQSAIERILGCSETVFSAAVYSGQESIPDIPRMTDSKLKTLVEQAAGVDVLAHAYELARGKMREAQSARADAQISLDRATERHQDAVEAIVRLNDERADWDIAQKVKIDNLKIKVNAAVAEYKKAQTDFDDEGEAGLKAGILECEEKIASVNEERAREKVLRDEAQKASSARQLAQNGLEISETGVRDAAKSLSEDKASLKKALDSKGQPCQTCTRPLDDEHMKPLRDSWRRRVEEREAGVRTAAENFTKAQARLKAATKIATDATSVLEDHVAGMTDVSSEGDRLRNLNRELQIMAALRAEINRLRSSAQNLAEDWKREAAATNPFLESIEREEALLLKRAAAILEATKSRDAAAENEEYAMAGVSVFAPDGVRALRLDEATPYLNERTAHYLGSLADGAIDAFWTTITETKTKGKMVEKFSVTVTKEGSAPTFNNLSGGEKRKVRLSCALALQDLVASRATKSIELWLGDEIDDALDSAGLERLMGVLEEKARERGTVLVISHNDIGAFARKTITVTKKNNTTEVSVN